MLAPDEYQLEQLIFPSALAPSAIIRDAKVGTRSQFVGNGPVPASMFSEVSTFTRQLWRPTNLANDVRLLCTHVGAQALDFYAGAILRVFAEPWGIAYRIVGFEPALGVTPGARFELRASRLDDARPGDTWLLEVPGGLCECPEPPSIAPEWLDQAIAKCLETCGFSWSELEQLEPLQRG